MKLFVKKNTEPPVTDEIPEKIHKRLHIVYFILKCVLCAMIFLLFWGKICVFLFGVPESGSEDSPFLRHEYCGTFFVEINRENSFASEEAYEEYLEEMNSSEDVQQHSLSDAMITTGAGLLILTAVYVLHKKKKLPKFLDNRYVIALVSGAAFFIMTGSIMIAASVLLTACLFLALRNGDKKSLFCNQGSDYFLISGLLWLVCNIVREVGIYKGIPSYGDGMIGVFSRPEYYCQLYRFTIIPVVLICGGLMLRRHELDLKKADTAVNTKLLKAVGGSILAGAGAFIVYRLGIRIYELTRVMSGDVYSVKLPFTVMDDPHSRLIELPFDMANTPEDYRNTILFRFVKDFPMFLVSAAAVIFFVKALLNISKGEINTALNRKYINIACLILVAGSLWFNLMGIGELGFFNNGFHGIYGEVTYTYALRAVTDTAFYALILWFFKNYMQAVPEKTKA